MSSSATFWWISLLAKRVSALSVCMTSASAWDGARARAPSRPRARRSRARRIGSPRAHAHLDVPEAGAAAAVPDVHPLVGLALAAVR